MLTFFDSVEQIWNRSGLLTSVGLRGYRFVLLENFENLWQEQQGKRQLTNQSIRIYSNKNQLKSSYFLIKLASIIKTALNV